MSYSYVSYTAPTGYPQHITVANISITTMDVNWDPLHLHEQNGEIIRYEIYLWETGSNSNWTIVAINSRSAHISNLDAHTLYTVLIAAATNLGRGPYSPALIVQTLEGGEFVCNS